MLSIDFNNFKCDFLRQNKGHLFYDEGIGEIIPLNVDGGLINNKNDNNVIEIKNPSFTNLSIRVRNIIKQNYQIDDNQFTKNGLNAKIYPVKGDGNCGRRSMMWGILIRAAINIESQDLELNQKGKNILDIMEADAKYLLQNGEDSFDNDNPDDQKLVELSNVSQRFSQEIVTVFKENNNANNILNLIKCIKNKQIHSGDLLKLATVDNLAPKGNYLNISSGLSALSGYIAYKAVKSSLKYGDILFSDFTALPQEYLQVTEDPSVMSRNAIAYNFGNNIDYVDISTREDLYYHAQLLNNKDGQFKMTMLTRTLDKDNPEHVKIVEKFVEEQFEGQFNEKQKTEIAKKLMRKSIVYAQDLYKTYSNLKSPVYCITNSAHTPILLDGKTRENLQYLEQDILPMNYDSLNQKSGLKKFLEEHANIKYQIQENRQSIGENNEDESQGFQFNQNEPNEESQVNNSQELQVDQSQLDEQFQSQVHKNERTKQIQNRAYQNRISKICFNQQNESNNPIIQIETICNSLLQIKDENTQKNISEKLFLARCDLDKIYTSCESYFNQFVKVSFPQKGSQEDNISLEIKKRLSNIKSSIDTIKSETKNVSIFKKIYEYILDFLVSIPAIYGIKLQRYENNQIIQNKINNIINNVNNINLNRY
ncbi:hypothetical protein [Lyticum sinuosum]|uniref:Uncharacterized protein n=1 Tax=Lyticum sinuosum TaxID=1332059 RepID=A0AAE5AI33_9RICK|nr:hypothetical protein [Lyticum sinuosum]MDZ5761554.1 hypothetical protein [Lyticum sinuosum]